MMATTDRTRASQHRMARAQKACVYCRHRKIRCTGERPQCKNCEIYDQDCVYAEPLRKPRPTNAALEQLREENRLLREQRSTTEPAHVSPHAATDVSNADPGGVVSPAPGPGTSPVDHVDTNEHAASLPPGLNTTPGSVGGASTYHGPTSTLFDDASALRGNPPGLSKEREAWMPKLLLAGAAEQRQMESINARAGKLDFDGVNEDLGMHLLNLHWNRQHHAFLVTWRPVFMRDMACGGPYFSKILLNAIYYGASKFSGRPELRKDPDDVRTAGWRFRNRVRDLLGAALDHSAITTIQALLQMSSSLFALGDEQSAAWVYAGTAFRMLFDLGLHVDPTMLPNANRLTDEDVEIRRRVYWAAFVVDKMQSLYQGRPASLRAADCQVSIKFLDTYEELEHWVPYAYTSETHYTGSAAYSVSTFKELCKLCVILNDILDKMYCEGRTARPANELMEDLDGLERRLQAWQADLPNHLQLDLKSDLRTASIPPPHVLSLLSMWNVLRTLLHRPFVSEGHLHPASPSVAVSSFVACAEAATNTVKLVRLYDRAFSIRRAPYLVSYATYVAATIHVRIAAARGPASEAHESLRTCLQVFDHNSETNYAVRKASMVIRGLMNKMDVAVDDAVPASRSDAGSAAAQHPAQGGIKGGDASHCMHENEHQNAASSASGASGPTVTLAPDQDLDAILQNFMQQEQQTDCSGPAIPGQLGVSSQFTNGMPSDPWGVDYGTFPSDMYGMTGFDDALFGFNTLDFGFYQQGPS